MDRQPAAEATNSTRQQLRDGTGRHLSGQPSRRARTTRRPIRKTTTKPKKAQMNGAALARIVIPISTIDGKKQMTSTAIQKRATMRWKTVGTGTFMVPGPDGSPGVVEHLLGWTLHPDGQMSASLRWSPSVRVVLLFGSLGHGDEGLAGQVVQLTLGLG